MIKIGNIEASNIMVGEEKALKIFVGNTLVWLNYTEIEYLESTGIQRIDTNYELWNVGIKAEIKILRTGDDGNESAYIGKTKTSGFDLYTKSDAGIGLWVTSGNSHSIDLTSNSSLFYDKNKHTVIFEITSNSAFLEVDGNQYTTSISDTNYDKNDGKIQLFSHRAYYYAEGRIYYCKIWDNGVLVLDLIPVRVGQTGYMYDKVSGLLFGNSGSGNFILGPDIYLLSDLQEIEYLESNGNQWIDTGIYINQANFEIGYEASGAGTWGWVHQNNSEGAWITFTNSSNSCRWWYGNYNTRALGDYQEGFYTIKYTLLGIDINDYHQSYLGSFREGISNTSLKFFSYYDFNAQTVSTGSNFATKFKSFYVKIGGVLVADFIPVRIGQVGYMYDKISKQLFANQGTGSFILGPDK